MYKFLVLMVSGLSLSANMIAGVAIVVKDRAITLGDIKKEMQTSGMSEARSIDKLIREKLEESEIKSRKITVTSTEVYDDIKDTAKKNNMSVSTLYEKALNSNGLSSSQLKAKIKQKLLSQKLYASIAYSKATRPTEGDLKEYYELHKEEFSHPESFSVVVYQAADQRILIQKIENPMFYSPQIQTQEEELVYAEIAPNLAQLLERTKLNSFTQVVPDGRGGFLSFYLKSIGEAKDVAFSKMKDTIENMILAKTREQVLGDHFARLKNNAEITVLRTIN